MLISFFYLELKKQADTNIKLEPTDDQFGLVKSLEARKLSRWCPIKLKTTPVNPPEAYLLRYILFFVILIKQKCKNDN